MRFKLDENVPGRAGRVLSKAGHEVATVLGQGLGGHVDAAVLEVCQREGRALVTLDIDFANIQLYPPQQYAGIIVIRLSHQDSRSGANVLRAVSGRLEQERLAGRLWIIDEHRVRIRPGDE